MKILLVKISSMGDVVHTMPVVADIHQSYPKAQIDWVVEEAYVDLVKQVRGVHKVIPVALRRWRRMPWNRCLWAEVVAFWRALRAEKYDWVIDAQGLLKSAVIGKCARGPLSGLANRTEGASFEWPVRFFYQKRVYIKPRIHVIPRSRLLVGQTLGYPVSEESVIFGLNAVPGNITPFTDKKYVVFVHAASRADKAWHLSDWIALGQRFVQAGYAIALPWGSSVEEQVSVQLSEALGRCNTWIPPHLSMGGITTLMAKAAAVVGLDTGLTHIATALARPTVQLHCHDTAWRVGGLDPTKVINLGNKKHIPTCAEVEAALIQLGVGLTVV